jgi:hypothetical protein
MYGLRAAVYCLKHPTDRLEFMLFPMIHIGSPEYYEEVRERLAACDSILFEGVPGNKARFLNRLYGLVEKQKRLGLVTQSALRLGDFRDKLIHADVSAQEFDSHWSSLPLRLRFLFGLATPIVFVYVSLFWTREEIARHLEIEDLPSREKILSWDEDTEAMDDVLLSTRDARLIQIVGEHHKQNRDRAIKTAILYGAGHMPAVTRFLMGKLGYRISASEWLLVFGP